MPIQYLYPGVYIEETQSIVHTIKGAATSITAFIGRALRGTVNEPIIVHNFGDYERLFGGLWSQSTMSFAVKYFFLNGGNQAIIVRVHKDAETAQYDLENDDDKKLSLKAVNPGSWGTKLNISVNYETKDPNNLELFNLIITDRETAALEVYLNVSVDILDSHFVGYILEASQLIHVMKDGTGKYIVPDKRPSEKEYTIEVKDIDGTTLTSYEITTDANLETNKQGLYALEKVDIFNILCIPPYLDNGNVDDKVITDAAIYCEKRRAFYIIDPKPKADWADKATALKAINAVTFPTRSKNAAIYFPRVMITNPLHENLLEEFAPCGLIAGLFARTDSMWGVWKAPAGLEATLNGALKLTISLTDTEVNILDPFGMNCLRAIPSAGNVVMGARTLERNIPSEWEYIPIRRLALFIEESLYRSTQWVVFEPNDEPLWAQIRLNVGAFMHDLFRDGAFQGRTPEEAYFVKCDKETTTQYDIDFGVVNFLVGFAPLKPAEFVVINIRQQGIKIE